MTHSQTSEDKAYHVGWEHGYDTYRLGWFTKARFTNALLIGHLVIGWAMVANLLVTHPPSLTGIVAALIGYLGAWASEISEQSGFRLMWQVTCIIGTLSSWLCFLVSLYLGA